MTSQKQQRVWINNELLFIWHSCFVTFCYNYVLMYETLDGYNNTKQDNNEISIG